MSKKFVVIVGAWVLFVLATILTSPGQLLHPTEDPAAPDSGVCLVNCAPANPPTASGPSTIEIY